MASLERDEKAYAALRKIERALQAEHWNADTLDDIAAAMREAGFNLEKEPEPEEPEYKVDRSFIQDGSRYLFDWELCSLENGWCQVDTEQDAPYFGMWVHPERLKLTSYVEGDVTEITFETRRAMLNYFDFVLAKYEEEAGRRRPQIDPGLNPARKAAVMQAGLGHYLEREDPKSQPEAVEEITEHEAMRMQGLYRYCVLFRSPGTLLVVSELPAWLGWATDAIHAAEQLREVHPEVETLWEYSTNVPLSDDSLEQETRVSFQAELES